MCDLAQVILKSTVSNFSFDLSFPLWDSEEACSVSDEYSPLHKLLITPRPYLCPVGEQEVLNLETIGRLRLTGWADNTTMDSSRYWHGETLQLRKIILRVTM